MYVTCMVIRRHRILIKSPCVLPPCDTVWQWDLLDFHLVLTRGWEAPIPIVRNRSSPPSPCTYSRKDPMLENRLKF